MALHIFFVDKEKSAFFLLVLLEKWLIVGLFFSKPTSFV